MDRKARILEVIRQGIVGGGETHVLELSKRLDQQFFDPVVLAFTYGPMIDQLNELGIENYVIPTEKPFDINVWKKVTQLILENNIKMIHAHGTRALSNVFWAGKKSQVPVIYTVHGWSFHNDQSFWIKKIRVASEKFLCKQADKIINVSEANQKQGEGLFKDFDSTIIKNGIDLVKFDPDAVTNTVRDELAIPKDVTLVGFISRLTKQKDPITLIRAFRSALDQDEDLMLLLVGEGDMEDETKKLVAYYQINDRVHFLPYRRDVPELLKAIDVYCLPSLWEGLPIGLLEAMAMRKAVIATNVDGTSEVINDNENGLLINQGDVNDLADKILLLHRDRNLTKKLSAAAKASIEKQFNISSMVKGIEKIYFSLLKK